MVAQLVRALVALGFMALSNLGGAVAQETLPEDEIGVEEAVENVEGSAADQNASVSDEDRPAGGGEPGEDATLNSDTVADEISDAEPTDEQLSPNSDARDWGRLQPAADLVEAGGPIIVILGVLSVVSLAIIFVKLLQFSFLRVGDHRFTEKAAEMVQSGRAEKALAFVSGRRGVVARVMETALRGHLRGGDPLQVREEVERVARVKLDGLERGLPLLSLIATVSPLLGLLGTVLGMIEAFQQLENAGDRVDPAILSGGIWEALLTTAAGLSVAIPAAAFFTWLQRSVDVAGQHMEDAATRIFTADLYSEHPRRKPDADSEE